MELRSIRGVGPAFDGRLREAGIENVADLAWVSDLSSLSERTGIPAARLAEFQVQAVKLVVAHHRAPHVALQSVVSTMLDLGDEVAQMASAALSRARGWFAPRSRDGA